MQELYLADDLMPLVADNLKLATCRYKFREIYPGQLRLRATNGSCKDIVVEVHTVVHTSFNRLNDEQIKVEAFDRNDLCKAMKSFYPDFVWDSPVTFVQWSKI